MPSDKFTHDELVALLTGRAAIKDEEQAPRGIVKSMAGEQH